MIIKMYLSQFIHENKTQQANAMTAKIMNKIVKHEKIIWAEKHSTQLKTHFGQLSTS